MATTLFILVRTLHFGSAMMLFTLPYFMRVILRPLLSVNPANAGPSFCQRLVDWVGIALIVEIISGAAWFWFIAAQTLGQSPMSLLSPFDLGAILTQTSFGQLWMARTIIGVGFAVALYFAVRRGTLLSSRSSTLNWLVVAFSGCLLVSLAWAGRAPTGFYHQMLHLLADTPHLLIGAIWPVGLIPMAYFLWYINRNQQSLPIDREVATLERFSQASLIAVVILLITGIINGWVMIGSWDNLVTTSYGKLLLGKIAVVGIMVAIGAINRLHLMPRIHDMPVMFQALRKNVMAESLLGLVVLFIVGMHT